MGSQGFLGIPYLITPASADRVRGLWGFGACRFFGSLVLEKPQLQSESVMYDKRLQLRLLQTMRSHFGIAAHTQQEKQPSASCDGSL